MRSRQDFAVAAFLAFGILSLALPLGESHSWREETATAALWVAALVLGVLFFTYGRLSRPPRPDPLPQSRLGEIATLSGRIRKRIGQGRGSHSVLSPIGERERVRGDLAQALLPLSAAVIGGLVPLRLIGAGAVGFDALGLWCAVLALGFLIWRTMERMANLATASGSRVLQLASPALLGVWILYLWQVVTKGLSIPPVLLPAPSEIGDAIASSTSTLAEDFLQTVVKSVIPGYAIGNLAGLVVALLVDKIAFVKRGLLPIGNLFSSLPIVGLAPIMVMWFGFDWQSKAAIVVVMTFFPMLVNTIAGLAEASRIERDLMRTYAASYWQTLMAVRLPAALPFIFNALKINSTLALIGAIVAEFFGSPTVGLGFRITAEAGRMNIVMVWAAIAAAAAAGSAFYGLLVLLERRATFWHPSIRQRA
jgi:NitT/TauT family transport system permease protein